MKINMKNQDFEFSFKNENNEICKCKGNARKAFINFTNKDQENIYVATDISKVINNINSKIWNVLEVQKTGFGSLSKTLNKDVIMTF